MRNFVIYLSNLISLVIVSTEVSREICLCHVRLKSFVQCSRGATLPTIADKPMCKQKQKGLQMNCGKARIWRCLYLCNRISVPWMHTKWHDCGRRQCHFTVRSVPFLPSSRGSSVNRCSGVEIAWVACETFFFFEGLFHISTPCSPQLIGHKKHN